jgi:FkbM family methyltransferase
MTFNGTIKVGNHGLKTKDLAPIPLINAACEDVPIFEIEEILKKFKFINYYTNTSPYIHEIDFHFFEGLLDGKTFCDVGANVGQSIVSLSCLSGKAKIHAFEINQALIRDLKENTNKLGLNVTYHDFGVGEFDQDADLFLPVLDNVVAHTMGSMNLEAMKHPNIAYHLRYLNKDAQHRIIKVKAKIRNFDALNIRPDFIKIDAEGAELQVLNGMRRTLECQHPVLLIENNFEQNIRAYMLRYGYLPFVYLHPLHALVMKDANVGDTLISGNTFYLHYSRIPEFQAMGKIASTQKIIHQFAIANQRLNAEADNFLDCAPTPSDVIYAHKLILGQDLNYSHAIHHWCAHATIRAMRDAFIATVEKSKLQI